MTRKTRVRIAMVAVAGIAGALGLHTAEEAKADSLDTQNLNFRSGWKIGSLGGRTEMTIEGFDPQGYHREYRSSANKKGQGRVEFGYSSRDGSQQSRVRVNCCQEGAINRTSCSGYRYPADFNGGPWSNIGGRVTKPVCTHPPSAEVIDLMTATEFCIDQGSDAEDECDSI